MKVPSIPYSGAPVTGPNEPGSSDSLYWPVLAAQGTVPGRCQDGASCGGLADRLSGQASGMPACHGYGSRG